MTKLTTPTVGRGAKRVKQGGVQVMSTHNDRNQTIISVYKSGEMVAQETVNKRGGYKYLQKLTRSKHLRSLEGQLIRHSVTLSDIGLGVGV